MDGGYGRLLRLQFNVKVPPAKRSKNAKTRGEATAAALPKTAGVARATEMALPFEGTIEERITDPMRAGALVRLASWRQAPAYFAVQPANGALTKLALQPPSRVDFSGIAATRIMAKSHDGVEVPVSIVYARNVARNGEAPLLLNAYGAYGLSEEPFFWPALLAWLERGGVFAVAHVRGGGEFGKAWHDAGRLANKQNVFDDFAACLRWLATSGWTRAERIAISGRSNGGLLAGATVTQHPDLFGAALAEVGVMDMLRFHRFTIGWGWTSDFGSPDDLDDFRTIYAYSPLHNIRPGTAYPPTIITTGDHDDRVVPGHSFKFAAALQAAQAGDAPVIIRIDTDAGHGAGKPVHKLIDERTDVIAFLELALGAARSN
jgi:prolyl oligopeptidase